MRSFLQLATLAVIGAAAASDVVQLTKDTFDAHINDNKLVLAEFFAPWCGHCKALAPEYEEAATTLKDKSISLTKIDCTEETDLCQRHGVEGYPTLKIFRGLENVAPYNGQRKAQAIVSYMVKQSLPAVSILDKNSIKEFSTADKVVVIAFLDKDDKASNVSFTEAAEALRDNFLFGATHDQALADVEEISFPSIVLYKTFDEGKSTFVDKFDKDAIINFAKIASTPLVGEVGPDTYADYMSAGIPLAYIFAETEEERTKLAEELKPIAVKHRGVINLATIDAKSFGAHAGNLNLPTDKFPSFAIQDTVNNKKYPFALEEALTHDALDAFVQDVVDGKISPSIKSEPLPESNDGPVKVIVAHNWEEIVLDDGKDVLVEFYAPWCGHCKALAPKYEELGALYKDHADKVVVAKVDATANDVPVEIQGFPTIKLYKSGDKSNPVDYSGDRSVEDMATFIKEHGKWAVAVQVASEEEEVGAAESLGEAAAAATESAKSAAADAAEAAGSVVSDATEAAGSVVSDATESVKSAATAATDAAKEAVSGGSHEDL